MAEFEIFAYVFTTNVKIAIFHAEIIAAVRILFDGERRGVRGVEHVEGINDDLDVASRHLVVL